MGRAGAGREKIRLNESGEERTSVRRLRPRRRPRRLGIDLTLNKDEEKADGICQGAVSRWWNSGRCGLLRAAHEFMGKTL